ISEKGYVKHTQRFVLAPGQREWKSKPTLRALPVKLQLESEPKGAQVFVDGKGVGVTPYAGTILPGRHKVSLRLTGYGPEDLDLEVRAARDVREHRRLDAAPVAAQITSTPAGAKLWAGGKHLGQTPWKGTLAAGKQTLELQLDGYQRYKQEVVVPAGGRNVAFSPKLTADDSRVRLETEPRGAEVWIAGKRVGKTPWSGELAPGPHKVEYRL